MTALLSEAQEPVMIPAARPAMPAAFLRPLSFRVRIVAEPTVVCRAQLQELPASTPPSMRVRALDTHLAALAKAVSHTLEAPGTARIAATVLASQAANVAFFLSRRPAVLEARQHGKFRV